MPTEFTFGFRRAWEHNRELVGGEYPAEQGDWGFGDGSSFTQTRTKNGLLQWVELARGGQRITFTDLRHNPPKRYVLEDPPSNKLVEVPSPTPQNPDTGQPVGHDTPSPGTETPLPGPEPTPPKPEPVPPETGNSYEGSPQVVVEGDGPDAISRAVDALRGRAGWLLILGRVVDKPRRQFPPGVNIRGIPGKSFVVRQDRTDDLREGAFWMVPRETRIRGLTFIGNFRPGRYGWVPAEVDVQGPNCEITDCTFENYLGMSVACNHPGLRLERINMIGNGSTDSVTAGRSSWGGLWAGQGCTGLRAKNIYGHELGGSVIFIDSTDFELDDVFAEECCTGFTEYPDGSVSGGGQICAGPNSRNGVIKNSKARGSGARWATGYELDGSDLTLMDSKAWGHTPNHGIVAQNRGPHTYLRVEAWGNKIGFEAMREVREYTFKDCNFHDNERNEIHTPARRG